MSSSRTGKAGPSGALLECRSIAYPISAEVSSIRAARHRTRIERIGRIFEIERLEDEILYILKIRVQIFFDPRNPRSIQRRGP